MYIPYLRGRQYELIAIRELLEKNLISNKVVPIIEPVKLSKTLLKTLKVFNDKNHEMIIICNPQVGDFDREMKISEDDKAEYYKCVAKDNIVKALIVTKNTEQDIASMKQKGIKLRDIATINYDRNSYDNYMENFGQEITKYNLIPDERMFSRKVKDNRILLVDRFNKQPRNVDYLNVDEFYSDDHLYFVDENYKGFADYSIVGNEYSESGFAPYAVAIHFVYFNEDDELYINHFVSDNNKDIKDPAGKFYEAVSKLAKWSEVRDISTYGYKALMKHYKEGTYPGLGVAKKLCVMHHIELIDQYLEAHSK